MTISSETLPGARRATKLRPLAGLLLLAGLLGSTMAQAAVITVHPGEKIQAAIDRATAGDEIHIERGRYVENLRVDRTLTLRGINRPTISGSNQGDTIRVIAPDVVIEGLIVTDSGDSLLKQNAGIYIQPGAHRAIVRNCFLSYNLFGLWIEKANDVQVLNNNITGKRNYDSAKRGNGVELYNTKGARIIGNEISFVRDALYIDVSHHAIFQRNRLHHSRYGTHYMNSYYNLWEDNDTWKNQAGLALMEVRDQTIRNNRAWHNTDHGIMLRTLQDATVENNWVIDNGRGLFVYDVEYTNLLGNVVASNRTGVHLSGSVRNKVDGNDFVGNQLQIKYAGTRDHEWGGEKGNYWSNYRGWDRNGDGRGDIPYEANDVQVLSNNITGKRDYDSPKRGNGVELYNTKGARIIDNEISFVRDALYIDVSHHAIFQKNRLHHSRYGTHYMNSYYNLWEDNDTWHNRGGLALMEVRDQTIRNNRAWKNSDHGIMLRTLQDSEVDGNWVANNGRGFFVYDVEYIKLRDNVVANNRIGVHLSGSPRNEVDGNDFVDNQQQVKYAGTRDLAWGGKKGNFWSNYRGWDRNDDGRGDIPYEANDMVDRLTWRYPGVRLLMASPAVQALRMVGQQFPILRVPSVVEQRPRMNPLAAEWAPWLAKTRNNLYNAPENLRHGR